QNCGTSRRAEDGCFIIRSARSQIQHCNYDAHRPNKVGVPPSSQPDDQTKKTEIPNNEATKTDIPTSSQLDDESVIKKAKATIAAKMGDPDSVEFEQVERAARKNELGESIDTICGFVKDKTSGAKPFVFLVQKE